jgi:hypothetical protein
MSLRCSIPIAPYVATCQGMRTVEGHDPAPCGDVGPNRHVVYTYTNRVYGKDQVVLTESRTIYCADCCPACRAKKEKEDTLVGSSQPT